MEEEEGRHAQPAEQHVEQEDLLAPARLKSCIAQPTMRPAEHLRDDVVHHLDQQLVEVLEVVPVLELVLRVGPEVERLAAIALPHRDPRWAPRYAPLMSPCGGGPTIYLKCFTKSC